MDVLNDYVTFIQSIGIPVIVALTFYVNSQVSKCKLDLKSDIRDLKTNLDNHILNDNAFHERTTEILDRIFDK